MTTPDRFKNEIGLGSHRIEKTTLTPITQIQADHILIGDIMARLLHTESTIAVDQLRDLDEFVALALSDYQSFHRLLRQHHIEIGDAYYLAYGDTVKIVGDIHLSPVGSQWFMNFRTTHVWDEKDTSVNVSCYLFTPHVTDFEPTQDRGDHVLVGVKSTKREVIGTYVELLIESGDHLEEYLQEKGWQDIGEFWRVDLDRGGGFIGK